MTYLDRSPGAFIALATLVVYGVVSVEIWMWTVASVAAVAVTLTLIAVTAVLICRSVLHLMEDGTSAAPVASPTPAAAPRAVAAPAAREPRRVRPTGGMAPTA